MVKSAVLQLTGAEVKGETLKETFEKLKQSSINFLRIKFATENFDIILPKEFISELDKKTYYPETFFKDYLHCILE